MRHYTCLSLSLVLCACVLLLTGLFIFKDEIERRDSQVFEATVQTAVTNYQDKLTCIEEEVSVLEFLIEENPPIDGTTARHLLSRSSLFAALSLNYLIYPDQGEAFYQRFGFNVTFDPANPFEVITVDPSFPSALFLNLMKNPARRREILELFQGTRQNQTLGYSLTDRRLAGRPQDFSIFALIKGCQDRSLQVDGFETLFSLIFNVPPPNVPSIYQAVESQGILLAETQGHLMVETQGHLTVENQTMSCGDHFRRQDLLHLGDLPLELDSCGENPSALVENTVTLAVFLTVGLLLLLSISSAIHEQITTVHLGRMEHKHSMMTAFVCHELRNPIMRLLMRCQLAQGEEGVLAIDNILRDASYASAIVKDVLDAKGVAEGLFLLHNRPIRLDEWLQGFMESLFPAQGAQVTFSFDQSLHIPISLDVDRVGQIIDNLTDTLLTLSYDNALFIGSWIERGEWLCITMRTRTSQDLSLPSDPLETGRFKASHYYKPPARCSWCNPKVKPSGRPIGPPEWLQSPFSVNRLFSHKVESLPLVRSFQGRTDSPLSASQTGYGTATAKILARGLGGEVLCRKHEGWQEILVVLQCTPLSSSPDV